MRSPAMKLFPEATCLLVVTTMIALAGTACFTAIAPPSAGEDEKAKPSSKVVEDYEKQVKAFLAVFQDDAIWKDPKRVPELFKALRIAETLRAPSLAPVLAGHIAFDGGKEGGYRTAEETFPVYAVLKHIGLPSVQPLLKELKSSDPRVDDWKVKYSLILFCLANIYEQGGHGKALAEQRIRLEIKTARGKVKRLLERALKHPALRVES